MKALARCGVVGIEELGAFVDNELAGHDRVRVAAHVRACASCSEILEAAVSLGHVLRSVGPDEQQLECQVDGLAPRVLGRIRAEEGASVKHWFVEVFDGLRWALVGAGALGGTALTTGLVCSVLMFGPAPAREDSLSALLGNLGRPPGYLFVLVSSVGRDEFTALLQVENGQPTASRSVTALAGGATPASRRPSEAQLVDELASTVTRHGRVRSLGSMDRATRRRAEALFDELTSLRGGARVAIDRRVSVHGLRLVTSVTAKS